MAHLIGAASGPVDLLHQLRIWLTTSRGWTEDSYAPYETGYRLHVHKGSTYLSFCSFVGVGSIGWPDSAYMGGSGISFYMGTGFDAGKAWWEQPGGPRFMTTGYPLGAAVSLGAGPFPSHQFFDDGNGNYLVMVERSPGVWRPLVWGDTLDKTGAGAWTGGAYFGSSCSSRSFGDAHDPGSALNDIFPMLNGTLLGPETSSFVRADVDTFTSKWLSLSAMAAEDQTGKRAVNAASYSAPGNGLQNWRDGIWYGANFRTHLYSSLDLRAVLLPMPIFAVRDAGGSSFLGVVPSIYVSASHLQGVAIGQDIQIGLETYRQFNGFLVRVID